MNKSFLPRLTIKDSIQQWVDKVNAALSTNNIDGQFSLYWDPETTNISVTGGRIRANTMVTEIPLRTWNLPEVGASYHVGADFNTQRIEAYTDAEVPLHGFVPAYTIDVVNAKITNVVDLRTWAYGVAGPFRDPEEVLETHNLQADPHPQYVLEADLSTSAPVMSVDGRTGDVLLDDLYEGKRVHNLTATVDPTVTDDTSAGYDTLSKWVNTVSGEVFTCISSATGAAVWEMSTLTIDDLGTAALAATADFDPAGSASTAVTDHVALADPHTQYVQKETGFGLSSTDYTQTEKTKLAAIEEAATADQTGAEIKLAYEAELDTNAYTDAEKTKLAAIEESATADQTGAEIKLAYEGELDTNAYTDAEKTKLAAIEDGATADQTKVDIDALGIDAATVGGSAATAFATSAQGTLADTALQPADVTTVATSGAYADLTGTPVAATTTVDGLMVAADKSKLDGVDTGATDDQTGAEIKLAYEAELDTNAFTDADVTKLASIEESATADQTGAEIKLAYEAELDTNAYTDAEKTKLAAIEESATANSTDATLLNRTNHTGTQTLSTISDAGTSASLDVPATGDAAISEVVKGDDTRLSDDRAPTAHNHTLSEITDAGTAAAAATTDFATSAQGALADTAVQPADITDVVRTGDPVAVPYTSVTAAYGITLADANYELVIDSGTALTITIPADSTAALPVGTKVYFLDVGAGVVTVACELGVTINGVVDGSFTTSGQYSAATATKIAADVWVIA